MSLELISKKVGFFESRDGQKHYYEVRGDGEPVIFIYGIACLINHWHHQLSDFSKTHQTVAYDLRGHHKSNPVQNLESLTLKVLGQDLVELCDHLGFKKVHVVAHSFGVPVALKAYEIRSDLFSSFCFINGFAKNPIQNMFGLNIVEPFYQFVKSAYEKNPLLWDNLWKQAVNNPLSMYLAALSGGFNLKLTHFKDIEMYAKGVAQMDLTVFMPLFEELMAFDGESILETLHCPALIISGENDRITPKSFQKLFVEKIKRCEEMNVPYGSHCTQLDFPEYVNLRLRNFWNSNQGGR